MRPTAEVFLRGHRTSAPRARFAASRWKLVAALRWIVNKQRHAGPEGPEIGRILREIRHGLGIEPKEHTEALIVEVFSTIVQKLGNRGNLGTVPTCLLPNQVGEAMNEIESGLLAGQTYQSSRTDSRCGHDRREGPTVVSRSAKTTRSTSIPWGQRACLMAASTASILSRLLQTPK